MSWDALPIINLFNLVTGVECHFKDLKIDFQRFDRETQMQRRCQGVCSMLMKSKCAILTTIWESILECFNKTSDKEGCLCGPVG